MNFGQFMDPAQQQFTICHPFGDDSLTFETLELALTVDDRYFDSANSSWVRALTAIDFASEKLAEEFCMLVVVRAYFEAPTHSAEAFTGSTPAELFEQYCQWQTTGPPSAALPLYDLSHFITGARFGADQSDSSYAIEGGACTPTDRCGMSRDLSTQHLLNQLVVHGRFRFFGSIIV